MSEPELKGPIKSAYYIHRAIVKESRDFRDAATALMADDQQGLAGLQARLVAFERVLKMHEDSEDIALFPHLQRKYPYIADTYEFDHQRHREHSAALTATFSGLGAANGNRRRDLVKQLGEQAVVFDGFMNLHISKENELLFPAYDQMFSVEEQQAHGEAMQDKVSPEEMAAVGGWMFQRLDLPSREGFLTDMKAMLPPEAFAGMTQGLMRAVPAADWNALVERVPGLAVRAA
jgi:hemerythrin-like domain-containing protein